MTVHDTDRYFHHLDRKLSYLGESKRHEKIAEDFPKYEHIGSYCDPTVNQQRDWVWEIVHGELHGHSFDPLLAFKMIQPKYSTEVLHPDCTCFRRVKAKERPIKTCSHRDRLLYACWNHYLSRLHKNWLTDNRLQDVVSAYVPRTGKSNAHYAKHAFDYIRNRASYSAVAIDVKSFFDQIPHDVLEDNLKALTANGGRLSEVDFRLFKSASRYQYIDREELRATRLRLETAPGMLMTRHRSNWDRLRHHQLLNKNEGKGIPQGLACSGVLANIVMMRFDEKLAVLATTNDSIYLRYADDIFVASPTPQTRQLIYDRVIEELNFMNLPLAEDKSEWFDFAEADTVHPTISYLGLTCQGKEVSVRNNGVNKFYERTQRFIFSYVLTCRKRGKQPSLKKIRAIFGHTAKRNYYAYLRRASEVFEADPYYKPKGIKGVMRNQLPWLEQQFIQAQSARLPKEKHPHRECRLCTCPLQRDRKVTSMTS